MSALELLAAEVCRCFSSVLCDAEISQEHELRSRPAGLPSLAADHRTFLAHVARLRKGASLETLEYTTDYRIAQRLPPFFALLTGPTLQEPYKCDILLARVAKVPRMEELCVTLGRVTQSRRLADIHVSDSLSLSHHHAQIEFRQNHNHYVLVNTSPNGTKMKTVDSEEWTEVCDW